MPPGTHSLFKRKCESVWCSSLPLRRPQLSLFQGLAPSSTCSAFRGPLLYSGPQTCTLGLHPSCLTCQSQAAGSEPDVWELALRCQVQMEERTK